MFWLAWKSFWKIVSHGHPSFIFRETSKTCCSFKHFSLFVNQQHTKNKLTTITKMILIVRLKWWTNYSNWNAKQKFKECYRLSVGLFTLYLLEVFYVIQNKRLCRSFKQKKLRFVHNRFNVDLKPLKRTIRFQIGCSSSRKKRISAAAFSFNWCRRSLCLCSNSSLRATLYRHVSTQKNKWKMLVSANFTVVIFCSF